MKSVHVQPAASHTYTHSAKHIPLPSLNFDSILCSFLLPGIIKALQANIAVRSRPFTDSSSIYTDVWHAHLKAAVWLAPVCRLVMLEDGLPRVGSAQNLDQVLMHSMPNCHTQLLNSCLDTQTREPDYMIFLSLVTQKQHNCPALGCTYTEKQQQGPGRLSRRFNF